MSTQPVKVGLIHAVPNPEGGLTLTIPVMVVHPDWIGTEEGQKKLQAAARLVKGALPDPARAYTVLPEAEGFYSECTVSVACDDKRAVTLAAEAVKRQLTEAEGIEMGAAPLGNNTVTGPDRSRRHQGKKRRDNPDQSRG